MSEKAEMRNQIVGTIASTMGGFSLGTVIGWSAPAGAILEEEGFGVQARSTISSVMCIGAAISQLYMAFTFDRFGRKWSMIIIAVLFIVSFVVLGMYSNLYIYVAARAFNGFCGGAFCVVAPTYIAEIAPKDIRGALGLLFQLFLVSGILFVQVLGLAHNRYILCFPLILPPAICLVLMIYLPESPVVLLMKEKEDRALEVLRFYRGKDYDIVPEINEWKEYIEGGKGSFKESMQKKSTLRAFLLLLGMHILQQLCGINAVMFYATDIFALAAGSIPADICTCIMSGTQVVASGTAATIVDRLGRRILWFISLVMMTVCLGALSAFYYAHAVNKDDVEAYSFLPLLATCMYIIGFNFAAGPLPWVMIGELLPSGAKGKCASIIAAINWTLAYAVTMSFKCLIELFGSGTVFLFYTGICFAGLFYVYFFVIETKNKTLQEIQTMLE